MKAIASINPLTYQLNMLRYGFENGSKDFLFVLMFSVMAFLLTTLVLKTGNLGTTEK